MQLTQTVLEYLTAHQQEAFDLLIELAQIPAPSNQEEKRAYFCKEWLEKQGARGVYIDEALNVIYPVGCGEESPVAIYMAHSDVVFPDTKPLELKVEDGKIKCPGVGDDTANVVALLMAAKFIAEQELVPKAEGVLIVINSGEEGLGNLKGCKKIVESFEGRISQFVTFDANIGSGVDKAVGSRRFCIEVNTIGGHSYGSFGNPNAIAQLAGIIDELYKIEVPPLGRTTYNVGTVSGGTSVNTIAQHAEMLYEYRSDEQECMDVMQQHLDRVIEKHIKSGTDVKVTCVGDRPCSEKVDEEAMERLRQRASDAQQRTCGRRIVFGSGSTDCNVPLSKGIPAICVGCCTGAGAHTREEYVEIASLMPGAAFCMDMLLHHF